MFSGKRTVRGHRPSTGAYGPGSSFGCARWATGSGCAVRYGGLPLMTARAEPPDSALGDRGERGKVKSLIARGVQLRCQRGESGDERALIRHPLVVRSEQLTAASVRARWAARSGTSVRDARAPVVALITSPPQLTVGACTDRTRIKVAIARRM